MERKEHWENIYREKGATAVSWYQPHFEKSLETILHAGLTPAASVLDVGGGASTFLDDLLLRGFTNITVLDISSTALNIAKARLGPGASLVRWIEADITRTILPYQHYDLWHDRAVFHFLTGPDDRERYVKALDQGVKAGGHIILSTFALDGPPQCSGLDVVRYSPESLQAELGDAFELLESFSEDHVTPSGTTQRFIYCHFRKKSGERRGLTS
jgi:SAM-dependent methyltransferase